MLKKKHALVLALAFCLALTLFVAVSTGYDPWVDQDEDGDIDANDLSILAGEYGSSGDPAKNVYMRYGTHSWTTILYLEPTSGVFVYNSTQGYEQVTLVILANATVDIYLDHSMFLDGYEYIENLDSFTVTAWELYKQTYDISQYPYLRWIVDNPSATDAAEVHLGMYMTASEDTTQNVTIKHSYYEWGGSGNIPESDFYDVFFDTKGYNEVTINVWTNGSANVAISFYPSEGIVGPANISVDSINMPGGGYPEYRTYSVIGGRLQVWISNTEVSATVYYELYVYTTT